MTANQPTPIPSAERFLAALASLQNHQGSLQENLQALADTIADLLEVDGAIVSPLLAGKNLQRVTSVGLAGAVLESMFALDSRSDLESREGEVGRWHLSLQAPEGERLGTIDVLYSADRLLTEQEKTWVQLLVHPVASALDRERLLSQVASLQASELKFYQLFEHANDAIFAIDPEGDRIVEVNPQACSMLGYSREELLDSVAISDIHPNEMPKLLQFSQQVMADGHGWTDCLTCLTKSGVTIPAEISAAAVELEGQSFILASVRNTAEQKERTQLARLSLAISEALVGGETLGEVLQNCTEAMVEHLDGSLARIWVLEEQSEQLELVSSAGMVQSIERYYCSIPLGKWKIGAIAQSRQPYLTNKLLDDPEFGDREWAAREGVEALAGYPLVVSKRLVGMMVLFSRQPLTEATLQAMSTIANGIAMKIDRDRSQKRAMQALRRLAEIGELAATIVHEVRNPLTTVLMGLTSLQQQDLTERAQMQLSLAHEEAERLQRLLNEILMYAKPQSMRKDRLDLNDLIVELAATLQRMPQARDRTLEVVPHQQPVPLNGDRDKLKQVFINLVTNAFEAIPAGETVTLTIAPDRQTTGICVTVCNGGEPIPADVLPRLTQPFQTTKSNGNGLGLAIVKRIVEAHAGTLTIESSTQLKGTRVRVVFPAAGEG